MSWYWWLLVGILIGWLLSTLIEWLWFRRKRMEVQDERVAELENALRSSADTSPSATQGAGMAIPGSAAVAGMAAKMADRDVALETPKLDMPAIDMPDIDLPDVSGKLGGLAASIDDGLDVPDIDLPDIDMPDVDLPDVDLPDLQTPDLSAKWGGAKVELGAAVLAAGAAASAAAKGPAADLSGELTGAVDTSLGNVVSANTNYPDDLTEVKGIGRVYETRLYRAGVYTWDQIATMDVAALEAATEAIDAANVADWGYQAQALAEANDRIGARYAGPLPDKLSALKGIGEGAEQQLYRAGIFTYAQLAAATPEELAAALPTSRGDFQDWIAQAIAST